MLTDREGAMYGVKGPERFESSSHSVLRSGWLLGAGSPVAIEALQLPLHGAADAAAIASVQPVSHDAQAIVPLLPVKRKVLYFGGNALATLGPRTKGSATTVLFPGDDKGSQPEDPARAQQGMESPSLYSHGDVHSIRGDRGGRVRDTSEVAGGEWGGLKHIIRHGAHFFLE